MADFLAYVCIKSCRTEKRRLKTGHETDVLRPQTPLHAALASEGQLTLPLIVGAETISGIRKLELPTFDSYENMALRLAGMMGHPFCEEYLGWTDGNNGMCGQRERILGQFTEMEKKRMERVRQAEGQVQPPA